MEEKSEGESFHCSLVFERKNIHSSTRQTKPTKQTKQTEGHHHHEMIRGGSTLWAFSVSAVKPPVGCCVRISYMRNRDSSVVIPILFLWEIGEEGGR